MWLPEESPPMVQIYDVLYRLGVTADYMGFFYTSYAIWLCTRQPERLSLVTKWLYPEVASHYNTNWKAVERDIRTVISVIWQSNKKLLSELAGHYLLRKPKSKQFLSILSNGVFPDYPDY